MADRRCSNVFRDCRMKVCTDLFTLRNATNLFVVTGAWLASSWVFPATSRVDSRCFRVAGDKNRFSLVTAKRQIVRKREKSLTSSLTTRSFQSREYLGSPHKYLGLVLLASQHIENHPCKTCVLSKRSSLHSRQ